MKTQKTVILGIFLSLLSLACPFAFGTPGVDHRSGIVSFETGGLLQQSTIGDRFGFVQNILSSEDEIQLGINQIAIDLNKAHGLREEILSANSQLGLALGNGELVLQAPYEFGGRAFNDFLSSVPNTSLEVSLWFEASSSPIERKVSNSFDAYEGVTYACLSGSQINFSARIVRVKDFSGVAISLPAQLREVSFLRTVDVISEVHFRRNFAFNPDAGLIEEFVLECKSLGR